MKDEADRIDEALAAWPANETTTEADWDAAAQRVVDHVGLGLRAKSATRIGGGVDDEDLLAPPLPETPEEQAQISSTDVALSSVAAITSPSSKGRPESGRSRDLRRDGMSTQAERQRDRSSFKELAALAAAPPPSSAGSVVPASGPVSGPQSSGKVAPRSDRQPDPNDSGLVDLHMSAVSDPQASERAATTPLAAAGLFDDDPPGTGNVASSRSGLGEAVPFSEPLLDARPAPAGAQEKGHKKRAGVFFWAGSSSLRPPQRAPWSL